MLMLWLACAEVPEDMGNEGDTSAGDTSASETGWTEGSDCDELRVLTNDIAINSSTGEEIFCEKYNALRGDLIATAPIGCLCEVYGTLYAKEDAAFPNLQAVGDRLYISINATDLSGFPSLTRAGDLDIRDSGLVSLHGMDALKTAETVQLHQNEDLVTLEGLPWEHLGDANILLYQNPQLTSLVGMEGLEQAYRINLNANQGLTSLEGLHNLTYAHTLGISGSPLTSLDGLRAMTAMGTFRLYDSPLTSLTGLEAVETIGTLDLRENQITSIEPLGGWTEMTGLRIEEDNLVDLAPLSELTTLQFLVLGGSSPPTFEDLNSLERIEDQLTITGPWTHIEGFDSLTVARSLNCYGSGLTTLDGLDLRNMRDIDLRKNTDLVDVTALNGVGTVVGNVGIIENTALGDEAARALVEAIGEDNIGGVVTIEDNHP
jgi:hypothetical protein